MFITDLDGTLFRTDQTISDKDRKALFMLGEEGVVRVAATGRSVFSLQRALTEKLPVDYLIFSTGTGIASWPEPLGNILRSKNMDAASTEYAAEFLESLGVDYMIHKPIPENHRFGYRLKNSGNTDFLTRLDYYNRFCRPVNGSMRFRSSQLLVIVPDSRGDAILETIRNGLKGFSVIRATSPFDGRTLWIEIFPPDTSKSDAAAWLAGYLEIGQENTVAVGNDYNDEDLLKWAGRGFIVENAPEDLKRSFFNIPSNMENGVSEAVRIFFGLQDGSF